MEKTNNKKMLLLLLLAVSFGLWIVAVILGNSQFQNNRLCDPLAMINSLFPLYYIAILLMALTSFGCYLFDPKNRLLYIIILVVFSVMLLYTPYLLAGFARMIDTPVWVGVSSHMPEVLAGYPVIHAEYALAYPASFMFNFVCMGLTGFGPEQFMILFPLLPALLFPVLWYLFIANLSNNRIAFLSMLLALPGLHYIVLRAGPSTNGLLLLVSVLFLLFNRGGKQTPVIVLAVLSIFSLILAHPAWPIFVLIFLAAGFFATILKREKHQKKVIVMTLFVLTGWLSYVFWFAEPVQIAEGAIKTLQNILYSGEFDVTGNYLSGSAFIFGDIYSLMRGVYALYAVLAVGLLSYIIVKTYFQQHSVRKWVSRLFGLSKNQLFIAFSVFLVSVLTVLLTERGSGAGGLTERGLSFLVLLSSFLIATVLCITRQSRFGRKISIAFSLSLLLFLTLSYPVIAFKSESSLNVPVSEEVGLGFLAQNAQLEGKIIAIGGGSQLAYFSSAAFSQPTFEYIGFPWVSQAVDLNKTEIMVFRQTDYYYVSMAKDLSFDNNSFIQTLNSAVTSYSYDKVYSSPSFQTFIRVP